MEPKKKKRYPRSRAEREAWNAHVDETLRRLRTLLEKAQADLDRKRAASEGT
jgi:hypothetical protein